MKTLFKLILILSFILSIGCTQHIKPEKFDVYPKEIHDFQSNVPIKVFVPENAVKEYLIEFIDSERTHAKIYVDLNDLYKNVKELIAAG